jgi:hypothetical protein
MTVFFLDYVLNGNSTNKVEICVMSVDDVLNPHLYQLPICQMSRLRIKHLPTDLFYVLPDKEDIMHVIFPDLRITPILNATLKMMPNNILCPLCDHSVWCSYKHCLSLSIDYLSNKI